MNTFHRVFAFLLVSLTVTCLAAADEAPKGDRTLFSNRAVQRELKLDAEQKQKINAILAQIEEEIARRVANEPTADAGDIATEVLAKQGPQLETVLSKPQAARLFQIGLQSSGPGMFASSRVQRALKVTPEQFERMSAVNEKMVERMVKAATDPKLRIDAIEKEVEDAKLECSKAMLELLTASQQRELDALLGPPFDLSLLKPGAADERPVRFVFGLDGHCPFVLLSSADVKRELGLTDAQSADIAVALRKTDQELTQVRVTHLKNAEKDFRDMDLDEQRRVSRAIIERAAEINRDSDRKIRQVLSDKQAEQLDRVLIRAIGARSLERDSISGKLNLTADQKASLDRLFSEFTQTTGPMRVVRTLAEFNAREFDRHAARLEVMARAVLTPAQAKAFTELGQMPVP